VSPIMNVLSTHSLAAGSRWVGVALLVTLQAAVFNGCSSSDSESDDGSKLGTPNNGTGTGGGSDPDDVGGQIIAAPGDQSGSGNSDPDGTIYGAETICDGKDDDGNGIIDDVD